MSKTKTVYRVLAKVGGYENVAGFGSSKSLAIKDFKTRAIGMLINRVIELHNADDAAMAKGERMVFYRYDKAVGELFERSKESYQENIHYYFDCFEQEYDDERGEWINKSSSGWYPDYDIKL